MPRLHLNLTNLDALQEWDMFEAFETRTSEQKPLRRRRDLEPENDERRLKGRGEKRRHNQLYARHARS